MSVVICTVFCCSPAKSEFWIQNTRTLTDGCGDKKACHIGSLYPTVECGLTYTSLLLEIEVSCSKTCDVWCLNRKQNSIYERKSKLLLGEGPVLIWEDSKINYMFSVFIVLDLLFTDWLFYCFGFYIINNCSSVHSILLPLK